MYIYIGGRKNDRSCNGMVDMKARPKGRGIVLSLIASNLNSGLVEPIMIADVYQMS